MVSGRGSGSLVTGPAGIKHIVELIGLHQVLSGQWFRFIGMSNPKDAVKNNPHAKKQVNWLWNRIGQQSQRQFALSVELNPRTLANWVCRGSVPADGVLAIVETLGMDPIQALQETGYLKKGYGRVQTPPIESFTNEEIVEELEQRLDPSVMTAVRSLVLSGERDRTPDTS